MNPGLKQCSESIFDLRHPNRPAFVGVREWVGRGVGLRFASVGPGLLIIGLGFFVLALGCAAPVNPGEFGPDMPQAPLEERAAQILAHAIRIRTVNPPGDERPLAEYYVSLLQRAGIESQVVDTPTGASSVGRAAAWGRLRGSGELPPLILLSHLDTVPVDVDAWQGEPFAGAREGGSIVGRGAVDAEGRRRRAAPHPDRACAP